MAERWPNEQYLNVYSGPSNNTSQMSEPTITADLNKWSLNRRLCGVVVRKTGAYRFIRSFDDLPSNFRKKDVFISSGKCTLKVGDAVEFTLKYGSEENPEAFRVWLIQDSVTQEVDMIDDNAENDMAAPPSMEKCTTPKKSQASTSNGPRDIPESKSVYLRGKVIKIADKWGFIKCTDKLLPVYIQGDVYFKTSSVKCTLNVGDAVEFTLKHGSEENPEAFRVWLIQDSVKREAELIDDNAEIDTAAVPSMEKCTTQKKSQASTSNGLREIAESKSVYLRGKVIKISDKWGFIKCTDKLLPDYVQGDVYFKNVSEDISLHDIVEFQLEDGSKDRPAACNITRIREGEGGDIRQVPQKKMVKRVSGLIVKIVNDHGYIKINGQVPDIYKTTKDVFFFKSWVHSGGFSVIEGDQVEFTISENRKREGEMTATKIKLIKCKARSPQIISDYITDVLTTLEEGAQRPDFLLEVLSCDAVWECIGRSWAIGDETIAELLDLLLIIHDKSHTLVENFKHMIEILVNSNFFSTSNGVLKIYIKNAWTKDIHDVKEKLKKFFHIVLDLLPEKARMIVGLSREMLPMDRTDMAHFFHGMLRKVTAMHVTGIENLDWDELPLVPATAEMLSGPLESRLHLSPVKSKGPYESTVEYMDTYFRLLRMDCFNALCVGIQKHLQHKLDPRDMYLYTSVELVGVHITDNGNGIALAVKVKPQKAIKNWDSCSNLMFGNLLCFSTTGKFNDPIWATVMKRDSKLLNKEQTVWVQLCSECNSQDDIACLASLYEGSGSTILAESPTYYLAYQPVLKALQSMKPDDLVFQEELIHIMPPQPPEGFSDNKHIRIPQTLDQSQKEAFGQALSHRLALIQGPPGTGKTYIGIKLVEEILSSKSNIKLPILVLTYKNHALDEFLKELLGLFPNEVARVGGRCLDPDLKKYNLQQLRTRHSRSNANYKRKIELQDEAADLKKKLEKSIQFLGRAMNFSVKTLLFGFQENQIKNLILGKPLQKQKKSKKSLNLSKDEIMRLWERNRATLFNEENTVQERYEGMEAELQGIVTVALELWMPGEEQFNAILKGEERLSQFLHTQAAKAEDVNTRDHGDTDTKDDVDIEDVQRERLAATSHDDQPQLDMTVRFDRKKKGKLPSIMPYAKRLASDIPLVSIKGITDPWELPDYDKAVVVQVLLWHQKCHAEREVKQEFENYKSLQASMKELDNQNNVAILQKQKVVGMTITGASIHNQLLQALRPAVIIVEEAAEVLEPQLIAVLGDWVKHLILIGDHMQLKPSVETYELVRKFNFDISMMERLINNNYPYTSLKLQNRMRPEIAKLLKDIYPQLSSNEERVLNNKAPAFIKSSHFFWSHEDEESKNEQNRSLVNESEADRVLRLALLFIQQGYDPEKITILGAYQGQVSLIRKMYRKAEKDMPRLFTRNESVATDSGQEDPFANKMKIHTIDMYQGDENEIVIISLVRSNKEGKIGFLKALNRRCVSQSRAKCGMYFVGNKETLSSQNSPWTAIINSMQENQLVSRSLPLQCPYHILFTQIKAIKASDISLDGLCKKPCALKMECGLHRCPKVCQPFHSHLAHECKTVLPFIHKNCGHPGKRECRTPESQVPCLEKCALNMQCKFKHPCPGNCQPQHSHLLNFCKVKVPYRFESCGHECQKKCGEDEHKIRCEAKVPFRFKDCRHQGTRKCYQACHEIVCSEKCTRILPCGHPCEDLCGRNCDPNKCKPCEQKRRIQKERQREAERKIREKALEEARKEIDALKRNPSTGVHRKDLKPEGDSAAEYYAVEDRVKKYVQPGHEWFPQVTRIEKVTNVNLHIRWLRAKMEMFDPTRSELKFHGTGDEGVAGIIAEGFRLPAPSKDNMYGRGVYFATDSSKSAQPMYTKNSNKLLLCEVLLGKSLTVNNAVKGMDDKTLKKKGYDSLYAKRDTRGTGGVLYDEFIIYNPDQALAKYIIHYSNIKYNDVLALPGIKSPAMTGLQYHPLLPKRQFNPEDRMDMHFRVAESQFLRLAQRAGNAQDTVKSVEYYINPVLIDRFNNKQKEFAKRYTGPEKDSLLAWHGTRDEQNIEKIMKENFRMDKMSSVGWYGKGIYFSELPDISIGYASSLRKLILCHVLPGKSFYVNSDQHMNDAPLKIGYDSHTVQADTKGRVAEMVIFDPDQILPTYVINF